MDFSERKWEKKAKETTADASEQQEGSQKVAGLWMLSWTVNSFRICR